MFKRLSSECMGYFPSGRVCVVDGYPLRVYDIVLYEVVPNVLG